MNFRLRMAAWSALSILLIVGVLIFTAHWHLDEELRKDRWDRTHPQFPQWSIHGSYTDAEVHDILGELLRVWVWVAAPLVLSSATVGYLIARRSIRPIRRINRDLAALDPHSFARGVGLPEKDEELALLVRHINDLLARVGDSYHEMAEFSARVAHELRTPLTFLRMRMESAAPGLPPDFSEEMQENIHRMSQLVERSLLTAKAEGGRLAPHVEAVDLGNLLEDLRDGYEMLAIENLMTLDWRIPPGLQVNSDPELLRQVFHNLLDNAIRHGQRRVRIKAMIQPHRKRIVVCITNSIGNPAQIGTGIGLRLVRAIACSLPLTEVKFRRIRSLHSARIRLPVAAASQTSGGGITSTAHTRVPRSPRQTP